jgi:hypothetical protein
MFLHPLWSVALLFGIAGVFIVIRVKHGKPLFDAFGNRAGWDWFLTWLIRFRSWVVNATGAILMALPDIIVALTSVDLTPYIGTQWSKWVGLGVLVYNAANTAVRAKPDGQAA